MYWLIIRPSYCITDQASSWCKPHPLREKPQLWYHGGWPVWPIRAVWEHQTNSHRQCNQLERNCFRCFWRCHGCACLRIILVFEWMLTAVGGLGEECIGASERLPSSRTIHSWCVYTFASSIGLAHAHVVLSALPYACAARRGRG